jgi:hypothetical protein
MAGDRQPAHMTDTGAGVKRRSERRPTWRRGDDTLTSRANLANAKGPFQTGAFTRAQRGRYRS